MTSGRTFHNERRDGSSAVNAFPSPVGGAGGAVAAPGAKRFIDGDLIETFLDLRREKQEQVVTALNEQQEVDGGADPSGASSSSSSAAAGKTSSAGSGGALSVADLCKLVEDLTRLH